MELIIVSLSGSLAALLFHLSEVIAHFGSDKKELPSPSPQGPQPPDAGRLRARDCQSEVVSGGGF
jgi:hypothetical protein